MLLIVAKNVGKNLIKKNICANPKKMIKTKVTDIPALSKLFTFYTKVSIIFVNPFIYMSILIND